MKRNPRKLRWTKSFRRATGRDLCIDSTFEFEKRRNVPVRYDRNLMSTTVRAMKKVLDIRQKRQQMFIRRRLEKGQEYELEDAKREVLDEKKSSVDLISAPQSKLRQVQMEKISKKSSASQGMEVDDTQ